MPKNPKRDPLCSSNVFFTNQKLQIQGVPLDRLEKFAKKSRIVQKKIPKGRPYRLPSNFGSLKNL